MISDKNTLIRITNLNLRFGRADDGPNSWEQRKRAYPGLLKQYPSDFYTFQEANDFQVAFLSELLPDYACIGHHYPAPDWWQSNLIFSHPRLNCLEHDHFYLSETPEVPSKFDQSRWPRQCTLGNFELGDSRLLVMTTHFDFDPEVQECSARLLQERLQQHPDEIPVILCGDFNTTPESDCYQALTSGGRGFCNAFDPPFPGTFHGFSGKGTGQAIDWILYRGEIELIASQLITEQFEGIFPSDHFGLTALFQLP